MERRFVLFGLLFVAGIVNHRVQLARERATHWPPGQLVTVNGHRLYVYGEGAGQPTLVFLAGSGTTAPTYDFRGLSRRLSTEYRTVVVERAGYGWSDESSASRDITTVLGETRTALRGSGHAPTVSQGHLSAAETDAYCAVLFGRTMTREARP